MSRCAGTKKAFLFGRSTESRQGSQRELSAAIAKAPSLYARATSQGPKGVVVVCRAEQGCHVRSRAETWRSPFRIPAGGNRQGPNADRRNRCQVLYRGFV